jgi:hypothetical protein
MVVKNQKNLIHDVVMNFIPKKKIDPPKVSLEQMVKDHTKLLAEGRRNISPTSPKIISDSRSEQKHYTLINEIEKNIIDKPIKISKVEPLTISDLVNSFGGEMQTKVNSRKRQRNHVKSTVEKLIDNKLKSEFIESLIGNNLDNRQMVQKPKTPIVSYNVTQNNNSKVKSLSNNRNTNNINKKIENTQISPITKKFKSENSVAVKSKLLPNKEQLFKMPVKKTNNLKDDFDSKRQLSASDNKRQNSKSDSKRQTSNIDNKRQNRTTNYLKNTSVKSKNETEIHANAFRDYEIKIKNSRKNSKKSDRKKSKKNKGSKKKSNRKSKNKSNDASCNIQMDKKVPNYLKMDLKQLIGNNIKINNDNFNFNKH